MIINHVKLCQFYLFDSSICYSRSLNSYLLYQFIVTSTYILLISILYANIFASYSLPTILSNHFKILYRIYSFIIKPFSPSFLSHYKNFLLHFAVFLLMILKNHFSNFKMIFLSLICFCSFFLFLNLNQFFFYCFKTYFRNYFYIGERSISF
jgi:hypothetical protein